MVRKVTQSRQFIKDIKNAKQQTIKKRIFKQIEKIIENPEIGKPLRYRLSCERTLYIKPFRLIYVFDKNEILLLRFQNRKKIYRK